MGASAAGNSRKESDGLRVTRWSVVLAVLAVLSLCVFTGWLAATQWRPVAHAGAGELRVFAYRGWQSTGRAVQPGELLTIIAEGEWMYSPQAGMNGPQGHPVFRAPAFYPVPGTTGGALIGKLGDLGQPFYVGRFYRQIPTGTDQDDSTLLYLRINDDLLGDNRGYVTARVELTALD